MNQDSNLLHIKYIHLICKRDIHQGKANTSFVLHSNRTFMSNSYKRLEYQSMSSLHNSLHISNKQPHYLQYYSVQIHRRKQCIHYYYIAGSNSGKESILHYQVHIPRDNYYTTQSYQSKHNVSILVDISLHSKNNHIHRSCRLCSKYILDSFGHIADTRTMLLDSILEHSARIDCFRCKRGNPFEWLWKGLEVEANRVPELSSL